MRCFTKKFGADHALGNSIDKALDEAEVGILVMWNYSNYLYLNMCMYVRHLTQLVITFINFTIMVSHIVQ